MGAEKDTSSRKFQLTFNNPAEKGISHESLKKTISQLKSSVYYCMADEVGLETRTPHIHLYIQFKTPVKFSRIKKLFPEAHIEQALGTPEENREYVSKSGKWEQDEKSDTRVEGTFEEWGEMPQELGQGCRTDIAAVYNMIVDGKSNAEIMALVPDYAGQISRMDKIRQDILEERYKDVFRKLDVSYIWGPTGTGKTRGVMEKHGYKDVYRVTDYAHPFDRYNSEPVLLLDEFRSSLLIGDMLQYLDGYPLALPARYANRVACYETVYIISNIELREQYPNVQDNEPATWRAFLRRIHHVVEFRKDQPPIDHGNALDYIFPPPEPVPDWVREAEQCEQEILPL